MRALTLTALAASIMACSAQGETQYAEQVNTLARELLPSVERAVGLEFRYEPAIAIRTKEQVHDYLMGKISTDFPQQEMQDITLAYRLFELIPDDLDLQQLVIDLYTEQVVGYYDPELDSLFVVDGADPMQLRLIVAHELVHALQAQYVALDSLLSARGDNDRRMAAQAVFEGQGILASLVALAPDRDFSAVPEFWKQYRQSVRMAQESMPVFSSAPLILRESLIFPYLGGADFVRWFDMEYPDQVPFGEYLPVSTEQILHPDRYQASDQPVRMTFESVAGLIFQDGMGEFDTRVFMTELSGNESTGAAAATGWGGDRYAVIEVGSDHALVWWTVWDTPQASRRFATVLEREWPRRAERRREHRVVREQLGARPAVLFVNAPAGWSGLDRPPRVTVQTAATVEQR
jgi:hypothetical protein